jgi:hypothetical protein
MTTRRTTRGAAKGKGKEREIRRTTRAEAIVSDLKTLKGRRLREPDLCPSINIADVLEIQNVSRAIGKYRPILVQIRFT